jgi:2-polyprenyl-3-methyl-5-hydroxy-6-metoxy-1,4-benzoquinol methylase
MLNSLKYLFFKKRRNKFINEMYKAVDPWSASLTFDLVSGFMITHTQGHYKSALDVGCGEGLLTATIRNISQKYTGIDVSEKALARAKEKNKNLTDINFVLLDFDQSNKLENKFDVLCFNFSLDYLGFQKHPKKFTESLYNLISTSSLPQCDIFIFNPVYGEKNIEDLKKYFFIFKNFGFNLKKQELFNANGFQLACIQLIRR